MKQVLFLIGSLAGGGAEKVLVDTVNSLDCEKYQITVQTLFDEGVHKRNLSEKVRYKSVITCKNGLLRKIIAKFLFVVVGPKLTYKLFVQEDYDYEIAFLEGMPTNVISRSTNKKVKKIGWVHTDLSKYPDSWKAFGSERKEAEAYNRLDKIFCVSKAVEHAFLSKYSSIKTPVSTLYNVIDEASIVEAAKENAQWPSSIRPRFISVGRLVEQKGYDRLLRIHKRLIEEGHLHSLVIVGDGPLRAEFEAFIAENKLQDTVCLLGFQSNPYKYMGLADVFVCSSYAEGFSTVITESVLCGTPVIGTDVSGNREPEEAPRCSVVVENTEEALYSAMRDVIMNPKRIEESLNELQCSQSFFKKENLINVFEESVFRSL